MRCLECLRADSEGRVAVCFFSFVYFFFSFFLVPVLKCVAEVVFKRMTTIIIIRAG